MSRSWSLDHPAPGIAVAQPAGGFKYTSDAFWLAGFALEPGGARTALDLGTGSGIVAFLLASAGLTVHAVDAEPGWAEGWARCAATGPAVTFHRASVTALPPLPRVDLVTCNPPYWRRGSGPEPRDPLLRAGRFEADATLEDFVDAGLSALVPGGTMALVLPAARLPALARRGPLVVVRRADRVLVRLGTSGASDGPADDTRVRGWYERFGSRPPVGAPRSGSTQVGG